MEKGETGIRAARRELGLTQAGLAKKLGNSSKSIARYDRGEREAPGPVKAAVRMLLADKRRKSQ